MRNHRNHWIVNVANIGNTIVVACRVMLRLLPEQPARLFGMGLQYQPAVPQQTLAMRQRRVTSSGWPKSHRLFELPRTVDSLHVDGKVTFTG